MISVASEKNISTAKKRDIAPFKVNGQSYIILQQLSCGTRSKVSFVSNPAQISLKHSSQLTNKFIYFYVSSPDAAAWILRQVSIKVEEKIYLRTDCI
jgi:hypothetical protein